ncbi:hypothetical protein HHK36_004070 [Tetracentron sinense]|uniref:CID domain-containing protein n=1 Tax=Tetracentron sinense TaxID=13715 RepID=A0A834ZUJ4_TETSI|nr:hypothetical protein HHK36_004070 [Tetracentron sinense]
MNSVFNEQILADKLSKVNSTQQCIETLSYWCIFHRDKADMVAATWAKQFHSSQMVQKVPFLYLANDILQNSKHNGNEFVNAFWKVLPTALKDVFEHGDEHGKNVVSRLVDIWEERRVFGSRARGLKDLMLGKELPPPLEFSKKRARTVRIVRKDSRYIRTKLAIGGTVEKLVSAFHSVLSERSNEDAEMSKCKTAVHRARKMEKDVDVACTKVGDPKRTTLANELEEEENLLKQCIEKLKSIEATKVALVSQLREALHEQESELENVRTQVQVAQSQSEEANSMRKQLNNEDYVAAPNPSSSTPQIDVNSKPGETPKKTAAAIAAEVADKLAASTYSQLIMTSVLSTFAAEEAKNAGFTTPPTTSSSFTSGPTNSVTDLRPKLEKPMSVSDSNVFVAAQPHLAPQAHQYQPSIHGQGSSSQAQYNFLPNPPAQQYLQPSGGIMTGLPYGYGNFPPLPPGPPPPPPHVMNMAVPFTQQQQPIPLTQQQPPAPPSFRPLQLPGMVYYSHPYLSQ